MRKKARSKWFDQFSNWLRFWVEKSKSRATIDPCIWERHQCGKKNNLISVWKCFIRSMYRFRQWEVRFFPVRSFVYLSNNRRWNAIIMCDNFCSVLQHIPHPNLTSKITFDQKTHFSCGQKIFFSFISYFQSLW